MKAARGYFGGDVLNVLILLTIALCLGAYLIVTTAAIAKDGVVFVNYARQFETTSVKAMLTEFQHPAYPWLIYRAHKAAGLLHDNTSLSSWIYCGQSVTLIFRLLALTVLYFAGKHLFGAKLSFWAILILILLPKPSEYGSDVLSDWPHLFFLVAGMALLVAGAQSSKPWVFGIAGLAAGVGYLVRPECAQLIGFGGMWLGLQLFWSKRTMSKRMALVALASLGVAFLSVAGPYMRLKGAAFPKKSIRFAPDSQQTQVPANTGQTASERGHISQFAPLNIARAFRKLIGNIGETLMWFFFPVLLIGMYKWFKSRKWHEPEKFFITVLVGLNILLMIWLYCIYGYMSGRHTLPLLIIPILYIPLGLQEMALHLHKIFSNIAKTPAVTILNERFWFLSLFVIGVSICAPKLFRPIRLDKQAYRIAAEWLANNTRRKDIVAVPDNRISFYDERKGLIYKDGNIPDDALYIVRVSKQDNAEAAFAGQTGKMRYKYVDSTAKKVSITIYGNMQERQSSTQE